MAKVLISGGTGTLGNALIPELRQAGHDVQLLTRGNSNDDKVHWNPGANEIDIAKVEIPDFVIHLAGANPLEKKWTTARKQLIHDSRIASAAFLYHLLDKANKLPKTYITASGISFYGLDADIPPDESHDSGEDFLAKVCVDWEKMTQLYSIKGIKTIALRTGIVLGRKNTALQKGIDTFGLGVAGIPGSGQQRMAWIHIDDWVHAVIHLINDPKAKGPFNLVAPNSNTMEFMIRQSKAVLGSKAIVVKAPELAIKLMLGKRADLVLTDYPVTPKRLLESGFEFKYLEMGDALTDLLAS